MSLVSTIEEILGRLPLRADLEPGLTRSFAQELTGLKEPSPGAGKAFTWASEKVCKGEIEEIATGLEHIAATLRNIHRPTTDALNDVGVFREPLASQLIHLATIARSARLGETRIVRGRRSNRRALAISKVLAYQYWRLTGKNAVVSTTLDGKAYGPFLVLVTDIFAVCGVEAEPERYARHARKPMPKDANTD